MVLAKPTIANYTNLEIDPNKQQQGKNVSLALSYQILAQDRESLSTGTLLTHSSLSVCPSSLPYTCLYGHSGFLKMATQSCSLVTLFKFITFLHV